MYLHGSLVLLGVTQKKFLNSDSISHENDVSGESYGLLGGLRKNMSLCIPHPHTQLFFPKYFCIERRRSVQIQSHASHSLSVSILFPLGKGVRQPFENFLFLRHVVRYQCIVLRCIWLVVHIFSFLCSSKGKLIYMYLM